jgi:predicted permease
MGNLRSDIAFAIRRLSKDRAFVLLATLVLSATITVAATVFSFADAVLFSTPAHLKNPARLVRVTNSWLSFDQFTSLRSTLRTVELAGESKPTLVSLGTGVAAEPVQARFTSHNYLSVLGVSPVLGRSFLAEEDASSAAALLDYSFWKRRYGSNPQVIGTAITVSGRSYTIVGIAPDRFTGIDQDPVDLWLSAAGAPSNYWLWIVARLRRDVSPLQARSELTAYYPADAPIMTSQSGGSALVAVVAVSQTPAERMREMDRVLIYMAAACLVLLLIACANLSGMFLNRIFQRRQEVAIRMQLGASRSRTARELLAEAMLLSMLCGIVSFFLLHWTTTLLQRVVTPPGQGIRLPGVFMSLEMHAAVSRFVEWHGVFISAGFAFLCTALCGLAPALYIRKCNLNEWLKGGREDIRHSKLQAAILVTQVAFVVILTISAGLFAQSLTNVLRVDFGVQADNVLVATADLQNAGYSSAQASKIFEEMLARVQALPAVSHVSLSLWLPLEFGRLHAAYRIPGREYGTAAFPYGPDTRAGDDGPVVNVVSAGYFETLGMRILRGRGFDESDVKTSPWVVIVNERMAHDYWPDSNALEHCIYLHGDTECRQIVGVVSSTRNLIWRQARQAGDDDPIFYVLGSQVPKEFPFSFRHLLIGTRVDAVSQIRTIGAQVRSAVPDLPFVKVERLFDYAEYQTYGWRAATGLFGSFGALALLIACAGVYSALALLVKQRTREIGVRLALGATPGNILRDVVARGMRPVIVGIVLGTVVAAEFSQLLGSLLFGVSSTDPISWIGSLLLILTSAIAACLIAAGRAAHVDPIVALRHD